jgi:hypothetical protein
MNKASLTAKQSGPRESVWTMNTVRRSLLFRPLAVLMAILMLPVIARVHPGGGRGQEKSTFSAFEAAAQTLVGCGLAGGTSIIQNYCGAGGFPVAALYALESDAVKLYLALHGLPQSEASVIYSHGRKDLRTAIRGLMLANLIAIIQKDPADRTSNEQALYNWLQGIVQRNEVDLYRNASQHYASFVNDPCRFTLDATVAGAMGISYSGTPFCFNSRFNLLSGPPVPSQDYFLQYGMKNSYGKVAERYEYAAALSADTQLNMTEAIAIGATAGYLITVATAGAIAASMAYIVVQATSIFAGAIWATISINAVTALGGVAAASAGPAAIILIAVLIAVTAGIQAFSSQTNADNNAKLAAYLAAAQANPPDLKKFVTDSSGTGFYKVNLSFLEATLPELESSSALPQYRPNVDPLFQLQPQGGPVRFTDTLEYVDWDFRIWNTKTWGGWMVNRCLLEPEVAATSFGIRFVDCRVAPGIKADIRYLDWNSNKLTASRLGNVFVIRKSSPASTDKPCPADPITGVSNGTDFSTCSSYASQTIQLVDRNATKMTVSLSSFTAPVFTGSSAISFAPGLASTQTITASGNPTPTICLTSGALPAGFTVPACSASPLTISFNGVAVPGTYNLGFSATNAVGTATRNVTVRVGIDVKIITPAILSTSYNQPVNFTIRASGSPRPTFSVDPGVNLGGLTFRDNNDGTATISGIAGAATFFSPCVDIIGTSCPRIRASNGLSSDSQIFTVQVAGPPSPTAAGPFSTTFVAGTSNQFPLIATGATTPVSWIRDGVFPSWLQLRDNGDGTGTLLGTPPAGTTGSFPVGVGVSAAGTNLTFLNTYTINVSNAPAFTNSNVFNFNVGGGSILGPFARVTATTGTVSLSDPLPPGFGSLSEGRVMTIFPNPGNPPAGSGGQYSLRFSATAPTGTATQDVIVRINEQPTVTSDPLAVMFAGRPGSLSVSTRGYPSTANVPGAPTAAPSSPAEGRGTYFTVTGLPPSLRASNLNSLGYATGTLRIQGTPLSTEAGTYRAQITAANGVGAPAQSNLTLLVYPYAPTAPVNLLSSYVFTRGANNSYIATVVVANAGNSTARNVRIGSARLDGVVGTILPDSVDSIGPASTATFTIEFPGASIPNIPVHVLNLSGTYTGGSFGGGGRTSLPN